MVSKGFKLTSLLWSVPVFLLKLKLVFPQYFLERLLLRFHLQQVARCAV